jgi:hypothetical protein
VTYYNIKLYPISVFAKGGKSCVLRKMKLYNQEAKSETQSNNFIYVVFPVKIGDSMYLTSSCLPYKQFLISALKQCG